MRKSGVGVIDSAATAAATVGAVDGVDSTLVDGKVRQPAQHPRVGAQVGWFSGRRGRRLRETLLAYAFLFPAFLIVGIFGLFPLLFAAYQSTLVGLNKIVGAFSGLSNYVKAIDNLAYVLFFWLAAILLFFSLRMVTQAVRAGREAGWNAWLWAPAGIAIGAGIALFVAFILRLLPKLLEIPSQMRGRNNTPEMFRQLLGEAWASADVQAALWAAVGMMVVGIGLWYVTTRRQKKPRTGLVYDATSPFIGATVMILGAIGLTWLTWTDIRNAYATALAAGEGLDIWSQIITISAGFLLLLLAWLLWESASARDSNASTALRLGAAAMTLVGAWFLIGELPRALAAGDETWWYGVLNTFYYSLGTIPLQLGIALLLATLLFQNLRGKSAFRIIYFIPYIAPFVGTAAVFRIIFSSRPTAPANAVLTSLGRDPLLWLNDPTGIFQMMLGDSVQLPTWAAGPSLALAVIIIYGTWSFIGFNTVIFMAGLGSIPRELYEASAMDGAGRWSQFRHITLPMLSPTIYFLTLYSVIGTFKAFNHIYVMRTAAALGTTDTASVVIFQAFKRDTRFGYASALAILLLIIILVLTTVNNRVASRRVFYG